MLTDPIEKALRASGFDRSERAAIHRSLMPWRAIVIVFVLVLPYGLLALGYAFLTREWEAFGLSAVYFNEFCTHYGIPSPPLRLLMLGIIILVIIALFRIHLWLLFWMLFRSGRFPACRQCRYRLDHVNGDRIRCPECGTLNDARRWVVDGREGDAGESRVG